MSDEEYIRIDEEDIYPNGHGEKKKTQRETFNVKGEDLGATLRRLFNEGTVRRIIVRNPDGKTVLNIPLGAAVACMLLVPIWSTVGALLVVATGAALLMEYTITVERDVI